MTSLKWVKGSGAGWQKAARWSPTMAAAAVQALSDSGESVAVFAARHRIDAHRFYDWRRKLRGAGVQPTTSFLEVVGRPSSSSACVFEVLLRGGDVVRVPSTFDGEALRKLLAAVRAGC